MARERKSGSRRRTSLPKVDYLDRIDDDRKKVIDDFLDTVGVSIKDYNLINRAFSHKSYTNEKGYSHNEQSEKLEFFGDGVLGLIINEYLFKVFPDFEEGELAKIKSVVVSEASLAEVAREIELARVILVGRSEVKSGGAERSSLLSDILEAFIGAVYMDQGLPTARKFVLRYFESSIRNYSMEDSVGDFKSYLQETVQKEYGVRPEYHVLKSTGPDHSRTFRVSVHFRGKKWGMGRGKSKKEAEQEAAEDGFKNWKKEMESGEEERGHRSSSSQDRASSVNRGDRARSSQHGRTSGDRERRPARRNEESDDRDRRPGERRSRRPFRQDSFDSRRGRYARPRRDSTGSRDDNHELPPADIDDPVAWAAGESYVRRRARPPADADDDSSRSTRRDEPRRDEPRRDEEPARRPSRRRRRPRRASTSKDNPAPKEAE